MINLGHAIFQTFEEFEQFIVGIIKDHFPGVEHEKACAVAKSFAPPAAPVPPASEEETKSETN